MVHRITLISGDGIGPEIATSVKKILKASGAPIEWDEVHCGLEAYERCGSLLDPKFESSLRHNKVALKGPTTTPIGGGHRSINVTMRQMFNLFANVRPVKNIPGIVTRYDNVDMIIVRENTEDLYKGIEYKISDTIAQGIKLITAEASERIGRHAFELAKKLGRRKVSAVHKANIMKLTDGLFLESIRKVAADYPSIEFNDVIVDNCCMQLVTKPEQFDVIVTENLYGDILSDLGAGLVGGLGVASGANLGEGVAIFEPVHGSAPDIAGKGLANPTAMLMSAITMLDYLKESTVAKYVEAALFKTLAKTETKTKDLGGALSTEQFTEAVIKNL